MAGLYLERGLIYSLGGLSPLKPMAGYVSAGGGYQLFAWWKGFMEQVNFES